MRADTYKSLNLDKDQLDAQFFYFILQYIHNNPLHVSSINAHHQEVNCIDAASGIVLSVSGRPVHMLREFSLNRKHGTGIQSRTTPESNMTTRA